MIWSSIRRDAMKNMTRIPRIKRIVMIAILLTIVAVVLASCEHASITQNNNQVVKPQIEDQDKPITQIYEHSFIKPKDDVIDIQEKKELIKIYISLGLPDLYEGPKDPISNVSSSNNHIYFVNNKDTFVNDFYNGSLSKLSFQLRIYFFELTDNKAVYLTESQPQDLYVKDMSTGTLTRAVDNLAVRTRNKSNSEETYSIPEFDHIIIINDHIFYKNTDGFLQRCTLLGSESTILTEQKVNNLKYNSGWIYYINQKNQLVRIGCDGNNEEIIIKEDFVDDYCIGENDIFYKTDSVIVKKYNFENAEVIASLENFEDDTLNIIGYESGTLYFEFEVKIFKIDISKKETTVFETNVDSLLYSPILIDDWIYFYKDYDETTMKFVRSNINTGSTEILGEAYEPVIEYY